MNNVVEPTNHNRWQTYLIEEDDDVSIDGANKGDGCAGNQGNLIKKITNQDKTGRNTI